MKKLDGKNTYLGIILMAGYNMLTMWKPGLANLISPEVVNTILGAYVAYGFRNAIKKAEK